MKRKDLIIVLIIFIFCQIKAFAYLLPDYGEVNRIKEKLDTASIDELINEYNQEKDNTCKYLIIEELGNREDKKVLPFLRKLYNKYENYTEGLGIFNPRDTIRMEIIKIEISDYDEDDKIAFYKNILENKKENECVRGRILSTLSKWKNNKPLPILLKYSGKENNCTIRLELELYKYDNAGKAKVLCNFMKEPNHSSSAYMAVGQLLKETRKEGWQHIKDLFIDIADKKVILSKKIEHNYRIDETIIVNVANSLSATGSGRDTLNVIKSNLHKFDKKLRRKIIRYAMGGITNNADEQTCHELISLAKEYDNKLVKEAIMRISSDKRFWKLASEEEKKFEMELKKKDGSQK